MASATPLRAADIEDIMYGACLLGSGGGGPLGIGRMLHAYLSTCTVLMADPLSDLADDAMAAVVLAIGAGDAHVEGESPLDILMQSFDALNALHGGKISHVMSGEMGAGSSLVPMVVAAARGIPVLDAAGASRAVPALNMTAFASAGIPIAPVVVVNMHGESSTLTPENAEDAERQLRALVQQPKWDNGAAVACWAMSGETIKRVAIRGMLSQAAALGKSLRLARADGRDPAEAVSAQLHGRVMARGRLHLTWSGEQGGFEAGSAFVEQADNQPVLIVRFTNETLLFWTTKNNKRPLLTAPDMICYMSMSSGLPFTNADLAQMETSGEQVAIIGAPSPKEMYAPSILSAFEEKFRALGYQGPPVLYSDNQGS